jgi:hypothetical protein
MARVGCNDKSKLDTVFPEDFNAPAQLPASATRNV